MELSSRFSAVGIGGLEVLSEDNGIAFCRGWRDGAGGRRDGVLAALPAAEQPTATTLDRLTHEYSFKDDLDGAWAVLPLALVHDRGRTLLLLGDPGGELLRGLVGTPMEVGRFLTLAIGIAEAVGKLHRRGLIHKDIKPANILVDTGSGDVRLTGFRIASRLTRERQSVEAPEFIGGTLAYMAPEQTGRMNRSIDSRSDLYSLGVTLYEMLVGALPFAASDPMEWVHCHIARQARAPRERASGIPDVLSSIVMKLLEKTVEERYQTAAGVETDLRQCLTDWQRRGRVEPFPLGTHDISDQLLIPERLYGREREIATLVASFDRVVTKGTPELALISGYSGVGKSSVVNELHKALVLQRGLFAAGKFDQYKRDIPYATLAQAFQQLIRPILGKSQAELDQWRETLRHAIQPHGALIVDLVPELELIVGEQEPVLELPGSDAQRRFQSVLRRFIGVFARAEHPLALFLDDLQWLDAATLDLLEDLLTRESIPHLLLIGAYRDNDVDPSHPLMRKLRSIKAAGISSIAEVKLGALENQHVSQLIADALHCETDQVEEFAQLILLKTGGNPFFINQFVSALADEGLVAFDPVHSCWSWDLERIHAKGYTDNVADLMSGKLVRLPASTQQALQQLACLGNIAPAALLATMLETTEQEVHAQLVDARRQELVELREGSYRFIHDRVHEAGYALIPIEQRAAAHLRIGKMLVAHTPRDKLEETIFEIVSQLNRATSLVTAPQEREQLAELNLVAGKRAQASSAYVSALNYFTAGTALLTEDSWQQRRELRFALELGKAHCEFATGAIADAEQRLRGLSLRAVTTGERAAVGCLQIDLYQGIGRSDEAVAVGLRSLRRLGIEIPERPTEADARRAYDGIWARLGTRTIEDLIDIPLTTAADSLAALDLLISVSVPGHFVDSSHLFEVVVCTAVSLGLERGHSDASCIAYVQLGTIAGPRFGQFDAGYRFGRLGCELAERPGLQRFQARAFQVFGIVAPWTTPFRNGREFLFRGFDLASRIGDITYAGYACSALNTNCLMAGDPLAEAQEQAERRLAFVRKVGFETIEGWILGQLGLIRSLRGLTARLGSFDDAEFRESDLEAYLADNPALALAECTYYIRKLQARFLAGDYVDALQAASKAQPTLWNVRTLLEAVEYHFYDALCHAAVHASASPEMREDHRAALVGHLENLDTWAIHCPENFGNHAALARAELARIEERELDAERQYEEAIGSARAADLVHNEGLANELAGRFYLARGFERIAIAYFREASGCYARWGADGKVRQLERLYPRLAAPVGQRPAAIVGSPVQNLDVASVVKASQALSGEIVLPRLIEQLMTIAIENAGADRGLLILPSGDDYLVEAEARAAGDRIGVTMRREPITAAVCPESLVRYVIRTKESVILDDAAKPNLFSADDYLRDRKSNSILCLPLIKQQQLTGILFLENTLASYAFTPARIAVLELLAAQAAISLENTRLYLDLQEREAKVRRLVDSNIIGILIGDFDGHIQEANQAFLQIVGYDHTDLAAGRLRRSELTPAEWHDRDAQALAEMTTMGTCQPYEKEYFRKDGSRVPVLVGAAMFGERGVVAFALDLTERKRAESELAHANRVATMGELTASIAHEVNQPLAALLTSAQTAIRWLDRQPPNLERAEASIERVIGDGKRAADIVGRIRDFSKRAPVRNETLGINETILEVMALARVAISEKGVRVKMPLAEGLPLISGDRVQLQQVILNLIMNAIEAMSEDSERSRELSIGTTKDGSDVLVTVSDSGPGLPQTNAEQIFDAFYTTKASGLGMGLSICRSIVNAHGGRLWATPNEPHGTVFSFTVPIGESRLKAI